MCLLVFFLLLGIAVEGSSAVCHSGSENLKPCSVQLEESTGRTIVSNGLPGHSIMQAGGNFPSVCEVYRRVKLPASPIQSPTATPAKDFAIVGFALNGVVIRNVQTPAVLIKLPTQQGTPCNGGVDPSGGWFYETVPVSVNADGTCAGSTRENDLVGYALDGFPIYGPLGTDARRSGPQLDECNGRLVDGNYRYHLMGGFPCFRAVPQVVETLPAEEGADCLALANADAANIIEGVDKPSTPPTPAEPPTPEEPPAPEAPTPDEPPTPEPPTPEAPATPESPAPSPPPSNPPSPPEIPSSPPPEPSPPPPFIFPSPPPPAPSPPPKQPPPSPPPHPPKASPPPPHHSPPPPHSGAYSTLGCAAGFFLSIFLTFITMNFVQ